MRGILFTGFLLIAGCQSVERAAIQALPEDGPIKPYGELLDRSRLIAMNANEAYYLDRWTDLEQMAQYLEQSARLLGRATDVPTNKRDIVASKAGQLEQGAKQLRELSKTKDVERINASLAKLHGEIRQLHALLR